MPTLGILNPVICDGMPNLPLAPQLAALRGACMAFGDNSKVNADLFLSQVKTLLGVKYGARAHNTVRKLAPKDDLRAGDLIKLAEFEAVIQGFGD